MEQSSVTRRTGPKTSLIISDELSIAFFKNFCNEGNSLSLLPGASPYFLFIRIADL